MCGFIAQLVEHRTGIAEVMGLNPVEALIFFRLLLSNCLNWKFTAMIILHFHKIKSCFKRMPCLTVLPTKEVCYQYPCFGGIFLPLSGCRHMHENGHKLCISLLLKIDKFKHKHGPSAKLFKNNTLTCSSHTGKDTELGPDHFWMNPAMLSPYCHNSRPILLGKYLTLSWQKVNIFSGFL